MRLTGRELSDMVYCGLADPSGEIYNPDRYLTEQAIERNDPYYLAVKYVWDKRERLLPEQKEHDEASRRLLEASHEDSLALGEPCISPRGGPNGQDEVETREDDQQDRE